MRELTSDDWLAEAARCERSATIMAIRYDRTKNLNLLSAQRMFEAYARDNLQQALNAERRSQR